jgi:hypothetical protein
MLYIYRKLYRKSYPQVIHHTLKNWWITLFPLGDRNVTMKWGKVGGIGEFVERVGNIGEEYLEESVTPGCGSPL